MLHTPRFVRRSVESVQADRGRGRVVKQVLCQKIGGGPRGVCVGIFWLAEVLARKIFDIEVGSCECP